MKILKSPIVLANHSMVKTRILHYWFQSGIFLPWTLSLVLVCHIIKR